MLKKYFSLLSLALVVVCLVTSLYMLFRIDDLNRAYRFLWSWPLVFAFFLFVCYRKYSNIPRCHFFGLSFIIFFTLSPKYLLYPLFVTLSSPGYTGIRHITLADGDIQMATLLVALELILVAFLLRIYEAHILKKEKKNNNEHIELSIKGSRPFYVLYLALAVIVFIVFGLDMNVVQFLIMDSLIDDTGAKIVIERSIYDELVIYIVSIAIALFTLICFDHCKRKYRLTQKSIYTYFAILAAMFFTACIVGESRGTQISLGLVMCLILTYDYPHKAKQVFLGVGSVLVIVILSITFARTAMGIVEENTFANYADKWQIYNGGPESLAQNIKIFEDRHLGIGQMIFDYIRSCFPFNLILKGWGPTTSQMYNMALYGPEQLSGHIVFSSSYSLMYMGLLGLPLTMFLGFVLALTASKYFYFAQSYEMKYLAGYCFMRLSSTCLVNTPSNLGSVTQYICTFGLLYFFALSFKPHRIKSREIQLS